MSDFARCLRSGRIALTLEITPPRKMLPGVLARRASLLGEAVGAVNVIQRTGRLTSLDACIALLERGLSPVWHLVVRGRSREEIATEIERARAAGIDQVLCILGDHAPATPVKSPTVRDVVAMVREALPDALIGATFNQYTGDLEKALRNLGGKCAAGATYVQTQPAFDPESFGRTCGEIRARHPEVAVVPMVMPLLAPEAVDRIEKRLKITVPDRLREQVADGPDAAWKAFESTVTGLVESAVVQGLAVMTYEMDPPPETGERIVAALRSAGVAV